MTLRCPKRKLALRLLFLFGLACFLWGGCNFLLHGLGSLLICVAPDGVRCDYILILEGKCSGDNRYADAARLFRAASYRSILLIERHADPIAVIGAVPTDITLARQTLIEANVPPDALHTLHGDAHDSWSQARQLTQWLDTHRNAQVLVLCDRFHTRYQRHVLDATLSADAAARLRLCGLPRATHDETNWWKSRVGVKDLMFAYLRLFHLRFCSDPNRTMQSWSPDAYERSLDHLAREVAP